MEETLLLFIPSFRKGWVRVICLFFLFPVIATIAKQSLPFVNTCHTLPESVTIYFQPMSEQSSYLVPSRSLTVEQEIKKSRFITTVAYAPDKDSALRLIESVRVAHPSASHNCYAYVAGNPSSGADIGFGDDGEVAGTAGKPMLSVLQHRNIGDVAVVVTRYFGGIRLGAGGLVRAYTSSVTSALDALPLKKAEPMTELTITIPYQYESAVRHVLEKSGIAVADAIYTEDVEISVQVPESSAGEITNEIMNVTRGEAVISLTGE